MSYEWFWEGNISAKIVSQLKEKGCIVNSVVDTESRDSGIDIFANKNSCCIIVEVKGYPSKFYQRGDKKGHIKSTSPSTQARHWYAEVLLTAILRKAKFPEAKIFIGLPNFTVYKRLIDRTKNIINSLGINFFIVNESSSIEGLENVVKHPNKWLKTIAFSV